MNMVRKAYLKWLLCFLLTGFFSRSFPQYIRCLNGGVSLETTGGTKVVRNQEWEGVSGHKLRSFFNWKVEFFFFI